MSDYTDRDVAEMIGMVLEFPKYECNGNLFISTHALGGSIDSDIPIPFGLSTPPGPDADANVARYVLPWLKQRFPKSTLAISMCGDFWEITLDTEHANLDAVVRNSIGEHFSPTLCRACLDAVKGDKNET